MNKFMSLFAKPLVSSSTKISPWVKDPPSSTRKKKTDEPINTKSSDIPQSGSGRRTTAPLKTPPIIRKKKHSLPLQLTKPAEPSMFNFEQYEDVVDTKIIREHREKQLQSQDSCKSPVPHRRHSWSTPHKDAVKVDGELLKKPLMIEKILTLKNNQNAAPLSPGIKSPGSRSRIDESAAFLLNDAADSMRKDFGANGMEFLEEYKIKEREEKSVSAAKGFDKSGWFESHDKLNIENLEIEEETKEDKEDRDEQGKYYDTEELKAEYPIDHSPVLKKDFMNEEERETQRDLFKKVSVQKAIDIRKAQNDRINQQVESFESSDSDVDSLVENNPFEDEHTIRNKINPFIKRMQTRLREDDRYSSIRFILFPDDRWRKGWDITMTIALMYTALVMPVRIAYITEDDEYDVWPSIEWLVDAIFFTDIILTFFTAYFDLEDNLVTKKKLIAKNYITGWFLPDLISVLPFSLFLDPEDNNLRVNNLVRVARIPRLYRLVRIIKLVRMVKIIKDRSRFKVYMNGILRLGPAYERLSISVVGIFLFCHISACLWYMLIGLGDEDEDWLSGNDLENLSKFDDYVACFYLVVQTVVTVGYGDLSPKTPEERLLGVFLMMFGVLSYSIFIGFVSSLINDIELMNQIYNHKLNILHRLAKEYSLSIFFQKKLKKAIKFQNKQTMDSKHFVSDLPTTLAVELACIMHRDIVDSIAFLHNRPKGFIASLCPLLKPITVNKKDHVFMEGDPADEIFFIKSGVIGYVLPKYKNECFLKVREGYFFGEIDLLFYGEIRKYTAIALKDCELYVLNKKDFKHVFLAEHRDIGTALYDNAYKRKLRTRKAFKEAVDICKNFNSNHKPKRIRLSISNRLNPLDASDSSGSGRSLLDIAEEDEEDEDEKAKTPKAEGLGVPVAEPKPININPLLQLKVALALKRGLKKGNISQPMGINSMSRGSISAPLASIKEEINLSEINKKLDGLESKLSQLAALGESMRSQTSRSGRLPVSSPNLDKSNNSKSLMKRVLALTPSNKPFSLQIDQRAPSDYLGVSPTNSDSSWNGFKSPNALRRNVLLKKPSNRADSLPHSSSRKLESVRDWQEIESDRNLSPKGKPYMELKENETSITNSYGLDQSVKSIKSLKEEKSIDKGEEEEKTVNFKAAFDLGLKQITEKEEEDKDARAEDFRAFLLKREINERKKTQGKGQQIESPNGQKDATSAKQNIQVEEY